MKPSSTVTHLDALRGLTKNEEQLMDHIQKVLF